MAARLLTETQGQTLILTISDPELRNALGPDIYSAGIEALNAAETNRDVRSVVLRGQGSVFCSGGNLNRILARRQEDPKVQVDSINQLNSWIESLRTFPKPIIAAIEGAAAGAGVSVALACDLIVAADDAFMMMAYANVGLSPDGGGAWALARQLPRPLAMKLLMLGERIGAKDLHALGMVSHVAPSGQALNHALEIAHKLNGRAPNVMHSLKELVNDAGDIALHQHLQNECTHFVRNLYHPNGGEGIQAFLDKRQPLYR